MVLQKILLFFFLFALLFGCTTSCTSNNKSTQESSNIRTSAETHTYGDSIQNPKINIKVNKQYDKKGHLIKYDSTYSYIYTSPERGEVKKDNEKIYTEFKTHFSEKYPGFFNHKTNDVFFNDSLFEYDFYNEDYFLKRFRMNFRIFDKMYKEMDSVKNEFLKKNYPQGSPKKNEPENKK